MFPINVYFQQISRSPSLASIFCWRGWYTLQLWIVTVSGWSLELCLHSALTSISVAEHQHRSCWAGESLTKAHPDSTHVLLHFILMWLTINDRILPGVRMFLCVGNGCYLCQQREKEQKESKSHPTTQVKIHIARRMRNKNMSVFTV